MEFLCKGERIYPKKCNWKGSPNEAVKSRHTDFGIWEYSFLCPKCKSKLASIKNNSPLNHPLQKYIN